MIDWTQLKFDLVFHKRVSVKWSRTEDKNTGMENMKEKLKEAIHLIGLEGKKRDNGEKK